MRKISINASRFSNTQILSILKQAKGGIPVPLVRTSNLNMGADNSLMKRIKELDTEK
jgi:hypothetical protein